MVFESVEPEGLAARIGQERDASSRAAETIGTQRPIASGPSEKNSTAAARTRSSTGATAGRQKTCFHQRFGDPPRRPKESDSRHGRRFLTDVLLHPGEGGAKRRMRAPPQDLHDSSIVFGFHDSRME